MKRCCHCGVTYPAAEGNFSHNKSTKDGYNKWCKSCFAEWRAANRGYLLEEKRRYYQEHKDDPERKEKRRQYLKHYKAKNQDRIKVYNREYRKANREQRNAYNRQWFDEHPGYQAKHSRRWREKNPEYREYNTIRYASNPDHWRQYHREWSKRKYAENPGKIRVRSHRRAARIRNLPNDFSAEDWQICLDYFGERCAVCGRPPGDGYTLAMDHWIPLTKGGGTTADNMIPLCQGVGGCNNHKSARKPLEFLVRKLGQVKARQKLAEIEEYFTSARNRKKGI